MSDKKTISFIIDLEKLNNLKSFADEHNVSLSYLIRFLVNRGLDVIESFDSSTDQFLYSRFLYSLKNDLFKFDSDNCSFSLFESK